MAKQARRTSVESGAPSRAADGFVIELTGDPAEIPAARQAIRDLAERHGFAQRRSDLSLALDELIANAQEHGRPPIIVRGWYDARLIVTVTDAGTGFDYGSVVRSHPPMMLGKRGRGLWITRQLTDHVTVDSSSQGTSVRIELTHEPQIGA
jgi:anti-sigma regulatory factor (Ser/Thr protein kinase)